jgi:hypothetical protein
VVGPLVCANRDRVAAMIVRAIDQQSVAAQSGDGVEFAHDVLPCGTVGDVNSVISFDLTPRVNRPPQAQLLRLQRQ